MLSFLFWNMGGDAPKTSEPAKRRARDRLLHRALINLVNVHRLDVIILAECPLETGKILSDLNRKTPATFREPDPLSQCTRITILSRFPRRYFSAIGTVESDTYTCRRIKLPAKRELPELLLIAVHLRS